jgi:transposase InsO family protein
VIGVSTSGYYASLRRPKRAATPRDRDDVQAIQHLYDKNGGTIGAKKIAGELKEKGHVINHKRVRRLMGEMNIKSKIRIAKITKQKKDSSAGFVYPNLLNRDFKAILPNRKWVTDMSELVVNDVKFYFSALMDLHNGEILAFIVSDTPNLELIDETIRKAMEKRGLADLENVIIHSDQGSVYRSFKHHRLAVELKFTPSMSRKANCWDNACIESFFSHLKTEFPHHYPVDSAEQVREDLPKFVRFFNEERSQKRLGYLTPVSYFNLEKQAS